MEGHDCTICRLSKLIEYKCNYLELSFLGKFEEFLMRYDKDVRYMKEMLKLKFEKTNRHIDESLFTVLNKGHRFECDLEKIYKKLLTLFAQPNQQNIAKCLFLKEKIPCNDLDITQYVPPECRCIKDVVPCNFEEGKVQKCCYCATKQVRDENQDQKGEGELRCLIPRRRRRLLPKKPATSIGKNQSPIAISSSNVMVIYMPAIETIGFHNLFPAPVRLENTGHTISLRIRKLTPKELKEGEFSPYIMGGKLIGQYEFEELHFHWGSQNYSGTEHIIDDIQYVMEMHIVFKNRKYRNFNEALGHSDGLAVMAFFYRISEFNAPEIDIIVENLDNLRNWKDIVELDTIFSLSSLIGSINMDRFYMYKGSLTTPPYSEAVTWIIFPEPLKISVSQIEKFRELHGEEEGSSLSDNCRHLQPFGNRRIFFRAGNKKIRVEDIDNVHHSQLQWFN